MKIPRRSSSAAKAMVMIQACAKFNEGLHFGGMEEEIASLDAWSRKDHRVLSSHFPVPYDWEQ